MEKEKEGALMGFLHKFECLSTLPKTEAISFGSKRI
jgi:hypothetical protein